MAAPLLFYRFINIFTHVKAPNHLGKTFPSPRNANFAASNPAILLLFHCGAMFKSASLCQIKSPVYTLLIPAISNPTGYVFPDSTLSY